MFDATLLSQVAGHRSQAKPQENLEFASLRPTTCDLRRPSGHGMAEAGRVASGDEVLELAFDVSEHAAGAEAEEMRLKPRAAQLFLHEREPIERLLRGADSTRGLEADGVSGALGEGAQGADHHQSDRK